MPNLVEIRDLRIEATSDAGRTVPIIRGVSLDIAPGEIVAPAGTLAPRIEAVLAQGKGERGTVEGAFAALAAAMEDAGDGSAA